MTGREPSAAMVELGSAKTELRATLIRGLKGSLPAERADHLIQRYQRALKAAAREKYLTDAADALFEMATDAPTAGQRKGLLNAYIKLRNMAAAPQPDTTKEQA